MNKSAVRGVLIFAAGAATAVLAGGGFYPPPPITPEDFQERMTKVIFELDALSPYLSVIEDGRVGIYPDPYACAPPTPPRPNLPKFAVDPYSLQQMAYVANAINARFLSGDTAPVYAVDKCKPYKN